MGHVAPVVVGLVAALLVLISLRDRSVTTQVLVASQPIPAGAAIDSGNTRLVPMHATDSALHAGLLAPASLAGGWVASAPITAGDPLTRSEVIKAATGTSGLGSMSIPVPIADADGGSIAVGDRVDVIAVGGSAGAAGAQYVAQSLRVLAVPATSSSGVLATSAGTNYYVVVAVDRKTALKIASALAATGGQGSSSTVEVVRSTGEGATS